MNSSSKTGHRERLRHRFLSGEDNAYSEETLLELLLTYSIPQKDVQPLAKKLLEKYGSLSDVLKAPFDDLCKVSGLKENSAVLIKLTDRLRAHFHSKPSQNLYPGYKQLPLIENSDVPKDHERIVQQKSLSKKRKVNKSRKSTGLFGKSLLKETLNILPLLPDTDSIEEIRTFIKENLHFSSAQTRERNAFYIARRMFPDGHADLSLRQFAKYYPNSTDLNDVCFYRFMCVETLAEEVIFDLFLPNINRGKIERKYLKSQLHAKFPQSRSIDDFTNAFVSALKDVGIAKADRTSISFGFREIPLKAFAFVLHSEYPESGMYNIKKLEENRKIKALLWNPNRILPSLYELRNMGIFSKISEIDNIRQFTTKRSLIQAVTFLISKEKNNESY